MARSRWSAKMMTSGLVIVLGAFTLLFLQIQVSGAGSGPARPCGSAFDAAADRSGWQDWWAQDLEDPAVENRQALLRTNHCPSAVNGRLVLAGVLAAVGIVAITVAFLDRSSGRMSSEGAFARLRTIGAVTAIVGALLTLAGVAAVIFLVADGDSTLFLYTDRTVVALAGVIVLVPAIALAIGGLALRTVGDLLERERGP